MRGRGGAQVPSRTGQTHTYTHTHTHTHPSHPNTVALDLRCGQEMWSPHIYRHKRKYRVTDRETGCGVTSNRARDRSQPLTLLTHSSTHLLSHTLIHSLTLSHAHPLTYSLTHSSPTVLTLIPTHPLTVAHILALTLSLSLTLTLPFPPSLSSIIDTISYTAFVIYPTLSLPHGE